jgi:outer membrane lipoprotein-sorting protein
LRLDIKMKSFTLILPVALAFTFLHAASPARPPADSAPLTAVIKKMDSVAASFRTTQAEFEWDTYEKVIDEVDDISTGTIYYRRSGKEVEMMADIKLAGSDPAKLKPEPKFVLFSKGKVRMYQPKPDQITDFDLGNNRADLETYVVLGFGGSGQDLLKTFDVTYIGPETVSGVATAKLQLVPKSEKVRGTYKEIFLWIDLDRGISVQQQAFQPDGNYRLAKYSSIRINEKIGDEAFKLKTTGKTTTISPRG